MTWVAAGVASGAATSAGVKYIKGRRDAKKDAKNRPQYQVPDEVKQNLSAAQQDALEGLPEEQKQMFLSNLERGQANSLSQIGSRSGGLAGVAAVNQNGNDAYGNLLGMDSAARMQNKQQLYNQRQNMADYKDQAFQFNTVNPYYEDIAQRNANTNELFQNLNNAAQMGGGAMGGMGGGKSMQTAPQNNDQMSQGFWNKKNNQGGMYNYNPNSQNGSIYNNNSQYPIG